MSRDPLSCPISPPAPAIDSRGMSEQEHRDMLRAHGYLVVATGIPGSARYATDLEHARRLARRTVGEYGVASAVIYQAFGIVEAHTRGGGA